MYLERHIPGWRETQFTLAFLALTFLTFPLDAVQQAPGSRKAAHDSTSYAAPAAPARLTASVSEAYVIGPEDVLAINVWKEPEISRVVPVRPDGKISLPLIGDLEASGGTTVQLRNVISEKLKAYISNPEVTVIVQEIKSQKYNVLGRVLRPGSYVLSDKVTVLDAIAMAGGFMEFAKIKRIYVLRSEKGSTQARLPFDYKAVIKGRKSDQNIELKPGDTIVVP